MSKSVLILDTPAYCAECDLYEYDRINGYGICFPLAIHKDLYAETQYFSPHIDRMPECPLISLGKVCKMAVDASKEE